MTTPVTLIFDLDGTLIETAPDLAAAMNAVLQHEGRNEVSFDEVRQMVGQGAKALIRKGMEKTGRPATEDDVERLFPVFMEYYIDHIADHSAPYPHLLDVLKGLKAKGFILCICTNKPEGASRLLLDKLNLSQWFSSLIGADTLSTRKPDAAPVLAACERAGGNIKRAIMIGDSNTDVSAARNAGIPVIGVTFGYTVTPMADLGPDVLVDNYLEFPGAVEEAIKLLS